VKDAFGCMTAVHKIHKRLRVGLSLIEQHHPSVAMRLMMCLIRDVPGIAKREKGLNVHRTKVLLTNLAQICG